jgi:hypothetical protein
VSTQLGPRASDDDATQTDSIDIDDSFAGLTAIDVVDGELVPRGRRRRIR